MDGELVRRKPVKGSHGEIVGATVMNGDLLGKDIDGIKGVGIVEAFLIFAVAAFDLTVVSGSIGAYELVSNAELSGGVFKKSRNIPFGVGKAVGKLKAIVGVDALDVNAPAGIPCCQLF